jgi:hypothetical protein
VTAPALSPEEYSEVERFGLHRPEADEHVRAMRRGFLVVGAGVLVATAAVVLVAWWLW